MIEILVLMWRQIAVWNVMDMDLSVMRTCSVLAVCLPCSHTADVHLADGSQTDLTGHV